MSDEKIEQAVFKIFRLTHEDQLNWTGKPAPKLWTQGTNSIFPVYFETAYQGHRLALFQERRKKYPYYHALVDGTVAGESSDWVQSARLALLGDNDEVMFEFPPSRQITNLFEAVCYKKSHVEQFLDDLLKSDPVGEQQ